MSTSKQVMTIAGSDSGGGAGIQADLKTFHSLGVFGTSIITAVTAQNTTIVRDVVPLDPKFIKTQYDTVMSDMNISSLKIGMLANSNIITAVAEKLRYSSPSWIVVDPVLAATSGDLLLEEAAVSTLIKELLPLSNIITPNISEAEILTGNQINSFTDIEKAAYKLLEFGPQSVLIKGGHTSCEATDYLFIDDNYYSFSSERVCVGSLHGTGCTLGAAICAYLSNTDSLVSSVQLAKKYVTQAIKNSFVVGQGSKVLKH